MTGEAGQPLQLNDEASWGQSVGLPMSLPAAGDAGARAGGAVEDGEGGGLAAMGPLDEHLRLSTVAEELRGPLSALVAATELLVHDEPGLDATQVLAMVTGIQRRALWLQVLVENVLCAATLRAGRLKLRRQPLDVWEVVAEVLPVVEPLLASRRQPLRRAGRPGPPAPAAVLGDGRRLGQALVNLLLHASALSPPGQPIELTVARRGAALRVTVADHGPRRTHGAGAGWFHGSDPPAPSDLPAPPAGGAGASSRSAAGYEGVELGLLVVEAIVEAHGGRVGAEHRRGAGARFWFELPCLPPAPSPAPEPAISNRKQDVAQRAATAVGLST